MPGTTSTALPSFSHDQHRKTDAAKRKRGHRHTKPPPVALVLMGLSRALRRRSFPHWHPCSSQTAASPMCFGNYRACCCSYCRINTLHIAQLSISLAHERSSENSHHPNECTRTRSVLSNHTVLHGHSGSGCLSFIIDCSADAGFQTDTTLVFD